MQCNAVQQGHHLSTEMPTVDDYNQYEVGCKNLDIKQFSLPEISKRGKMNLYQEERTWLSLKKVRIQLERSQTRDLGGGVLCLLGCGGGSLGTVTLSPLT